MNRCGSAVLNTDANNRGALTRAISLSRVALGTAMILPLAGCAVVTGTASLSQVRIIDASPDAPGLDVYQGASVLAYNLGLGTITSYIPINPGNYGIVVDSAGTKTQLVSASGTFAAGAQYTVLVGNYSNSLQELILKDQTQPAPSGQIAVRFIDQSTRAGAVDLYLIPSGSTIVQVKPVLTNITYGGNTGYFNVPAGTYTLAAVPTGTTPTATGTTLYTGSAITYAGGAARTIVLIDQQLITQPGLQVIIANDYDSPAS
jgi:hypothetical protein